MRRRDVLFGSFVTAALSSLSRVALAQPVPPRRVAVLAPGTTVSEYFDAFRARLRELGYVEGRDILLDYLFAGGRVDRLQALAEELVRDRGSDLAAIVALSTPAAVAAHKATTTIPILTVAGVDPVGSGLAASLARPGGNVTGVTLLAEELNAKRTELIHETFPRARRLAAVAAGAGSAASSPGNLRAAQEAGRELGITVEIVRIDDLGELSRVLSPAALAHFDGFIVVPDVILSTRLAEVVALLGATHRPVVYPGRSWAAAGGLMSLGPDIADAYRRLASQLDRIFRGGRPGELPFERPTKFELIINLRTAKALGLDLRPDLVARADEVIE